MTKTPSQYNRTNAILEVAYAGLIILTGVFFVWSLALGGWKGLDFGPTFWAAAACAFLVVLTCIAGAFNDHKAKGQKTDD